MTRYLAMQTNNAGRPCGWGVAATPLVARRIAVAMWRQHSCYHGEAKGQMKTVMLTDDVCIRAATAMQTEREAVRP